MVEQLAFALHLVELPLAFIHPPVLIVKHAKTMPLPILLVPFVLTSLLVFLDHILSDVCGRFDRIFRLDILDLREIIDKRRMPFWLMVRGKSIGIDMRCCVVSDVCVRGTGRKHIKIIHGLIVEIG